MMRGWGKYFIAGVTLVTIVTGGAFPVLADSTNAATVPLATLTNSPVQIFRVLLVMTPEARVDRLKLYPPGLLEPIEAKVKEYLALNPNERELRLQATELRHYLLLLMPLPATNRSALVAQIAEPMRSAVAARLEIWQLMPPSMQEEILANERMVRYFTQLGVLSAAERKELLATLPEAERVALEASIARWKAQPEKLRTNVLAQLNQFFELTNPEREQAMSKLSDAERDAMKQTLEAFSGLAPEQRQTCIRSFGKFANMSLAERRHFLKQAEAWQKMTPSERERWRKVVALVPQLPPLPPGMVMQLAPEPESTSTNTIPATPARATNGG